MRGIYFIFLNLFYFIQSDFIISKFPYRINEITYLLINQTNIELTRGALGPSGRAPRRYGFPFLYEKIITYGRNGKTCNEARMSYGCGPAGSRSDFQGISAYETHLARAEIP